MRVYEESRITPHGMKVWGRTKDPRYGSDHVLLAHVEARARRRRSIPIVQPNEAADGIRPP
jgi:hypothetical protein